MDENLHELLHRENLSLSTMQKRAAAFFIDELLLSVLLMIVLWDQFANATSIEETINLTNTFLFEYMMMKVVYQTFFVMQYGATLGKIAMKIRVMDVKTGASPDILASLNRAIFRVISEIFMYLGFLWGYFDKSKQTWHDKTAKTVVVDA